jgi:hypothetical protein
MMFLLLGNHPTKARVVWEKFSELNVNGDLMAIGFKESALRGNFGLVLALNIL